MKKIILAPLFAMIIMTSCVAPNNQLYYWGNYSSTLYSYTKEPSAKTRDIHKKELLNIVSISEKQHKRVAPGIYAELGHINLTESNQEQAAIFFQKELALYPESKQVIDIALQKKPK